MFIFPLSDSEGSDTDASHDNDIDGSQPDDVITDDVFVFDFEPSPEISKINSTYLIKNNNTDELPNKVLFRLGDSHEKESEGRTMASQTPGLNLESGKAVGTESGKPDDDTRDWNLLMLVLSAFTFLALCLRMAPEPFILTVSGGEIIKNLLMSLKRR